MNTAVRRCALAATTLAVLAVAPAPRAAALPDFGSLGTGSLDPRPPGADYLEEHFDVNFVFESRPSSSVLYRTEITSARSHCVDAMSPTSLTFNQTVAAGAADGTRKEVFSYDPSPEFDGLIPKYCFWENNYAVWAVHIYIDGADRQDWQVEFLNGSGIGYGTAGGKISVTQQGLSVTVRIKR
ncbi:hypothetical protein nbrc107696_37590 [Gordonia spumicola]|uniref:Secreted protein n=1 Tax=Gordonia spumicola TaxID=589161 RepID=A0A7I9VDX8_9ACTN|nr:hypothetical protein [Gordonia spumicola]GEE03313.1 hypothetical protein nbrc107696_37590 [Gordonia spumicola]